MPHDPQPLDLDAIEAAARNAARIGSGIDPDTALMLAAEIRRLRARVWELKRPTVEAKRNEIRQSFTELTAQASQDGDHEGAFSLDCQLREREEQWKTEDAAVETHVVADDSDDPEHVDDCPGCEDTLPAWLAQRFDPRSPDWDALSDDDRAYWEHHARAVRRAVARNGFKATQAGADDEGLSGPCDCGEGAVHYTLADCPAARP